jgi:hypothetical protein
MFKTIDQHEHIFHKDLVDPFLKELKSRSLNLYDAFPDHPKAAFILAKENPNRINGGAILVKRKEETLHPLIRERLDAFIRHDEEVWAGSIILQLTPRLSGQDFECFSKIFYRKLYESLMAFGRQERTAFLCLTLTVCEYKTTDLLEHWPYALTIRPKESGDGFFHCILALTGRRNETTYFWKSLSALTKIKDLDL